MKCSHTRNMHQDFSAGPGEAQLAQQSGNPNIASDQLAREALTPGVPSEEAAVPASTSTPSLSPAEQRQRREFDKLVESWAV